MTKLSKTIYSQSGPTGNYTCDDFYTTTLIEKTKVINTYNNFEEIDVPCTKNGNKILTNASDCNLLVKPDGQVFLQYFTNGKMFLENA